MDDHNNIRLQAPDFQVENLWNALGRLDRMLDAATAAFDAAAVSSGAGRAAPYEGAYVTPGDVRQTVKCKPGKSSLACADSGMAAPASQDLRLSWLQQAFGLDMIDLDIVLIALAPEVDVRYERQFAYLQGEPGRRPPTVDLVLNLLCASRDTKLVARGRFAPDAPLLGRRLLQLDPIGEVQQAPLLARHLKLEESVVRFLLGRPWVDARLRSFARLDSSPATLPGTRAEALGIAMSGERFARQGAHFYLRGPLGGDQDEAAASLAARLRSPVLIADLDKAEESTGDFANVLALLFRDAQLLGAVLYLRGLDALAEPRLATLAEALEGSATPTSEVFVVMSGARPCAPRFRTMVSLPVDTPAFRERRALWVAALRDRRIELDGRDVDELASRYRLTDTQIKDAVASVGRQAALLPAMPSAAEFAKAARLQAARDPSPLARKLTPSHVWNDLVLPESQLGLLKEVCSHARYRHVVYDDWGFDRKLSVGKGLGVLFTGPPGTGKTMAADVIANDLGLELFKIDLSQVVSKYIGETEKGLDRLFAEAHAGNAVLFFDECDALFGKRTTVQDAHDRYANIEVAYLLQKLEEHEGLCILATNLRPNLDVAFTRRLSFIIDFPFPDEQCRRRLWQSIWPEQVPRSKELDLEFMATQFKLSGGAVKNIAVAAAFLAARNGGELRTEHLLRATRSEIEKSGHRMAASEFGRYGLQVDALAGEGAP